MLRPATQDNSQPTHRDYRLGWGMTTVGPLCTPSSGEKGKGVSRHNPCCDSSDLTDGEGPDKQLSDGALLQVPDSRLVLANPLSLILGTEQFLTGYQ